MVGVGKLLKQAQKMQQKMEEAQALLSEEIIEVSGGGELFPLKFQDKANSRNSSLIRSFSRRTRNLSPKPFSSPSSMPPNRQRRGTTRR